MRAASVGTNTINVIIPPKAFNSERTKAIVTFEDMWLMMNLQRLDVQLVTVFALYMSLILSCVFIHEFINFQHLTYKCSLQNES